MGGVGEDDNRTTTTEVLNPGRKAYWRSQSWSASRSTIEVDSVVSSEKKNLFGILKSGAPPLTPRSQQNCKARSCLPPLQPLSIARRSVDEWPNAGSDDVGEWAQPQTPGAKQRGCGGREDLKVDISLLRSDGHTKRISFFDKECSKVADHVYLSGDAVAKNREILRKNGITHVLNCVGFVCPEYFKSDLIYKTLWLQDNPSEDITSILYDVFDYFEDVREQNGRVLVHCCQGVSRSTSLVIAYLMWRKGQSFEDAFDFVKAARGIANPNMGFACQLLQCQKRVHAIPSSPNSVVRMYRMAPHSSYDALHLVPKMLNDPSPLGFDSRGAFILHVLSSIYVWVGNNCKAVMKKDAKAAAYQVVRYERVTGPIYTVEEGEEPFEFWEAFLKVPILSDITLKMNKEQIDSGINIAVGKRKVEAYDADFELFYKGLAGGVVPPFSLEKAGHEMHLPARECNWSTPRRKKDCISPSKVVLSRILSDSLLSSRKNNNIYVNRTQVLCVDYLDSSLDSHLIETSPVSVHLPTNKEPSKINMNSPIKRQQEITDHGYRDSESSSPLKFSAGSLAERRRNFASMDGLHLLPPSPRGVDSTCSGVQMASFKDDGTAKHTSDTNNLDNRNNVRQASSVGRNTINVFYGSQEDSNTLRHLAYNWPDLKKIDQFCLDELDSKGVYLLLNLEAGSSPPIARNLCIWIGKYFEGNKDVNWNQVGLKFLSSIDLPNIPIKVLIILIKSTIEGLDLDFQTSPSLVCADHNSQQVVKEAGNEIISWNC